MPRKAVTIFIALFGFIAIGSSHTLVPSEVSTRESFIWGGLDWSPDGEFLAVGTSQGVWLHNGQDVSQVEQLNKESVTSLDWSPSGDQVANGSSSGLIQITEVKTGENIKELHGHSEVVTSVQWSPDGSLIASGSWDDTIRIWNVGTGEQVQQIDTNAGVTINYSIVWSSDSQEITFDTQGEVWTVQARTGEILLSWPYNVESSILKRSPNGELVAVNSWGNVRVLEATTGNLVVTLDADSHLTGSLAWSPDSERLATLGSYFGEGLLQIWDMTDWSLQGALEGCILTGDAHDESAINWNFDGSKIACASNDGKIFVWNTSTYELLASYEGYKSIVLLST